MMSDGDFVDVSPIADSFELDFTVQLFVYHCLSDHNVCISSFTEKQLILIIFQMTTCDILEIKANHEKYKRYEVNGTQWSDDGDKPIPKSMSQPQSQSILDEEKTKREQLPREGNCEGCGQSGDGYEMGVSKQCQLCKKWSHSKCMEHQSIISLPQEDGMWACPSCSGIIIWTDLK